MSTPAAALVLLAAGSGTRAGLATNKVFADLAGSRVLTWSLRTAAEVAAIGPVVLVVRPGDEALAAEALDAAHPRADVRVVLGGVTRHASEWNALRRLAPEIHAGEVDVVVLHDAARPLAPAGLFGAVVDLARAHGGAVPGRLRAGLLHRQGLHPYAGEAVTVQTPQAFRAGPLLDAYTLAAEQGFEGTDTAACVERYAPDLDVRHLAGPASNLKITFAEDLAVAASLLARRS